MIQVRNIAFVVALAVALLTTAYWVFMAFLSPLYTVGGIRQGWILVGHAWITVFVLIAACSWAWRHRDRSRWLAAAALALLSPASFGVTALVYDGYNEFYYAGVHLP